MSLAQKFRGFISSKATVATLTGVLAVLPLFNGNAQAQEPAVKPAPSAAATLTAHHATEPVFTRATSAFGSAGQHAQRTNEVAFWIMLPKDAPLTFEKVSEILVTQMAQRGVPAHVFGMDSKDNGVLVNVFMPDGGYQNPMTRTGNFGLRSIMSQFDTIAAQYHKLNQKSFDVSVATPSADR